MTLGESRSLFAAGFSDQPWWWQTAPSVDTGDPPLPDSTDVVVVGSGYTGLCCALELARAGRDVTVIEAGELGSGASTRAAGFVSGRAGVSKQIDLEAAVGIERAKAILEEADEAYEHFQDRIAAEGIDCQFAPVGRFVGAHTPAAYAKLERKMQEYNSDGRGLFEMVPRQRQSDYIASDVYHGGMFIKNAGSVNPARYHRGLLDLCRRAGVRFVARTRVLGIADDGGAKLVRTTAGTIRAREAALGTNGYTDRASPWHRRRIVPLSSTIIATEELGRERVDRLLPAGCPVIDTKRVIAFARPSPEHGRLLFGGRARFTPVGAEESVRILHRRMTEMFPDLHDVKITNAWSGLMGFTFDFLPKLGRHEGVHYALGCNGGAGIVMMSWLGRQMARNILATANRKSAFEGLAFRSQAFYAGKPWFVPIVGSWYQFRDWLELRAARA